MKREENISQLSHGQFDVCIIGAGASGAGCALDAVLRGMKVVLIEKEDFSAATSSRSTKLIHGGVRYLEQAFKNLDFAQLRQVKHGLEERHAVLSNAPHLARPLAIITPVATWIEGLYFSIGLKLYGLFAGKKDKLPKSKWLSKAETLSRMPTISRKMNSSVLYYDGQLDDARYGLALAHSADEAGAAVINHTTLVGFEYQNEKIIAANVIDNLSGQKYRIQAKLFINCTGPYADSIRLMANPSMTARIKPSKGVHLILPKALLPSEEAMLIPKTPDGRLVFVIPFEGKTLVGTTDNAYEGGDAEPLLENHEVDFLLTTLAPYLEKPIDKSEVLAGFGGLRPLISAKGNHDTKALLRDHEVEHDPKSNLISLLGGKWTTYRLMATDTINLAATLLENTNPCITEDYLLMGAEDYRFEDWKDLVEHFKLPESIAKHLMLKYGSLAIHVCQLIILRPELALPLHPDYPYIQAEVTYTVREEMACTLRDVLARRMRFEFSDWQSTLEVTPIVAKLMAIEMGWDEAQTQIQIKEYEALVRGFINTSKHKNIA